MLNQKQIKHLKQIKFSIEFKNTSRNDDKKTDFYISNMHKRRLSFESISYNEND